MLSKGLDRAAANNPRPLTPLEFLYSPSNISLIINLASLVSFLIVEIITTVKEYLYINEFTDKAKEALATGLNWLLDPDSV